MLLYSFGLRDRARILRNAPTDAERALWCRLRGKQLGTHFYRQKSISHFIVDFYCPEYHIVIEADSSQHSHEQQEYDIERDMCLRELGLTIVRFDNREILKNIDGVIQKILELIDAKKIL